MRTIEIPEELYQYLTKMAVLMKTQEIKGTSFPLYCIYDKVDEDTTKFMNCFFTAEAMNKHMEENKESFTNPFTHIRSAAYNEEMKELMKFVVSLDELVLDKHNNLGYE